MARALAGEGLALPATPALAQRHSGKPRHQVEFCRPYVAEGRREHLDLAVGDPVVMGNQTLCRDVVLIESEPGIAHGECSDGFTGWQPLKIWHPHLDHEATTRLQVSSHVLEAGDLLLLRCQIHDRVEDQIGNREKPIDGGRGEVTDRDADLLSARLSLQSRDHRFR